MNALGLMDTLGLTLAIFMTNFLVANCTAAEEQFLAASVKVDITPENSQWLHGYGPRKSEGVHDRIFHRIVAMHAGDTEFFLIEIDESDFEDFDGLFAACEGNQ